MHELLDNPTDDGSSEGPPLFPSRPTVKHRSHSLQRKARVCELAGSAVSLRSIRRILLLWRSRHSWVGSLVPRSSSLACAHGPHPPSASIRNYGLRRGGHTIAGQRAT